MNAMPMDDDSADELLPAIAGHDVVRQIGEGGYGKVWLARNKVTGAFRAAKVISRKDLPDERSFQREFDGICNFDPICGSHPGLVRILHVDEDTEGGYYYYVMELADDVHTGQTITPDTYRPLTLKEEMANHPRLAISTKLQIALALTSALDFIHGKGLIHRDIKPSNIIFVNGMPKIADIGLTARAGEETADRGTLYYMPGEGPGTPTADIFSLGIVFYELFMGMQPKDFPELPHAAEQFTSLPELLAINNLILKACHHDPRRRFQTAKELYKALQAVGGTIPDTGSSIRAPGTGTSDSSHPGGGPQLKARWARPATLIVSALVAAAAVFAAIKRTSPVVHARGPVVVSMDTTAPMGVYDLDNKTHGGSNAKEINKVLGQDRFLPPTGLHQVPLYGEWDREDHVISLHPDLVIVHRSAFFHSYNAELLLGSPSQFTHPAEDPRWRLLYRLGDERMVSLIGNIANEVPQTRFLVYSRGTDTNWLSAEFRSNWVKRVEYQYPKSEGRIFVMVVPNGYKGTFRDPKTAEMLRDLVKTVLGLPAKREPAGKK